MLTCLYCLLVVGPNQQNDHHQFVNTESKQSTGNVAGMSFLCRLYGINQCTGQIKNELMVTGRDMTGNKNVCIAFHGLGDIFPKYKLNKKFRTTEFS